MTDRIGRGWATSERGTINGRPHATSDSRCNVRETGWQSKRLDLTRALSRDGCTLSGARGRTSDGRKNRPIT